MTSKRLDVLSILNSLLTCFTCLILEEYNQASDFSPLLTKGYPHLRVSDHNISHIYKHLIPTY
ncbi:hypothetical protein Avbf_09975 [Armadillidium vulgare]|nr:hypothetical protein Avbf_09975 [Armadillidium vulgare]